MSSTIEEYLCVYCGFYTKKSVKSLIIKTFKNNLLKIHMKKNDL